MEKFSLEHKGNGEEITGKLDSQRDNRRLSPDIQREDFWCKI
jgi:hypothetical protein